MGKWRDGRVVRQRSVPNEDSPDEILRDPAGFLEKILHAGQNFEIYGGVPK